MSVTNNSHSLPQAIRDVGEYLLHGPLYSDLVINDPAYYKVIYGRTEQKPIIDGYCPSCSKLTSYRINGAFVPNGDPWNSIKERRSYDNVRLTCARNEQHAITIFFLIVSGTIKKVGQMPSLADIANDESKMFKGVISKADASELHKAIGLASHGVGIGSFVYLRRVFERLVEKRFSEFKEAEGWQPEEFRKLRMNDKIGMLRDHLPHFMVENRKLYSILSAGVHSLNEEICLKAFDLIKRSILMILEEDQRKKEELALRQQLGAAIAAFDGEKLALDFEESEIK